jgi:hypothetical protein
MPIPEAFPVLKSPIGAQWIDMAHATLDPAHAAAGAPTGPFENLDYHG